MGNPKYWWFEELNGEVFICKNTSKAIQDGEDYRLKLTKTKHYPAIEKIEAYQQEEGKLKVYFKNEGSKISPRAFKREEFLWDRNSISRAFKPSEGNSSSHLFASSVNTWLVAMGSQESQQGSSSDPYAFSDGGSSASSPSMESPSTDDENLPGIIGLPVAASTPVLSRNGSAKRRVPIELEQNTGPMMLKKAKTENKELKIEQFEKECDRAVLGIAKISIGNLRASNYQIRPVQDWKVQKIVESMEKQKDYSYQKYYVLTTSTLPDRNMWSEDTANGFVYEVVGGQHSMHACKKMLEKNPEEDLYKSRECEVYYAPELSFEGKKYLGMKHNQLGEKRWKMSTREKVQLCRSIYMKHKDDETPKKGVAKWRQLCAVMLEPLAKKELKTMLSMAQQSDTVFNKCVHVIKRYEEGKLLGQKAKASDVQGKLQEMPMYQFRSLFTLSDDNMGLVLDMIVAGDIAVNRIKAEIDTAQKLQRVKSCLLTCCSCSDWVELEERFPRHMTRDVLANQFRNLTFPKDKDIIPKEINQWALELERIYAAGEEDEHPATMQGEECAGYVLNMDAANMSMDNIKNIFPDKVIPGVKLCIIDLPQEWNMLQLQGYLAFTAALNISANTQQFTSVVLCDLKRIQEVVATIHRSGQYASIRDCYYHVENAPQGGILPSSVHGFVVAHKQHPDSFEWSNGRTLNFFSVIQEDRYKDEDGNAVDVEQKPAMVYEYLIKAITTPQQWVLDACCGTGTGLITALKNRRNCLAVDSEETVLQHLHGRWLKEKDEKDKDEGEEEGEEEEEEAEDKDGENSSDDTSDDIDK